MLGLAAFMAPHTWGGTSAPRMLVPGRPNAMIVRAYGPMEWRQPPQLEREARFDDAELIGGLVGVLNGLRPVAIHGWTSCPMDDRSHFGLVFLYADGTERELEVERTGCQFVRAGGAISAYGTAELAQSICALVGSG